MFPDVPRSRAAGTHQGIQHGACRDPDRNQGQSAAKQTQIFRELADRLAHRSGGLDRALLKRYHRAPKKLEQDYVLTNAVLGVGVTGGVHLAKGRNSNCWFAVKSFDLCKYSKSRHLMKELATELEIMLTVDHPHIVRLLEVYESASKVHFVMEYAEGGELFDRLVEKGQFCEGDAAETTRQMLTVLAYLHGQSIVHRDVKPENFIYETKEGSHLLLTDFGHSQRWNGAAPMTEKRGTLAYSAPEVFQKSYTSKVDIWSVGVITYILLTGRPPFDQSNNVHQSAGLSSGEPAWSESSCKNVSADGIDFLKSLLCLNMAQRPPAHAALQHCWITGHTQHPPLPNTQLNLLRSLRDFKGVCKLQRSCLLTLARSMTRQDISTDIRNDIRSCFLRMDVSHCGKIEAKKLAECIAASDTTGDEELKQLLVSLSTMDLLSYSDFLAAMVPSFVEPEENLVLAAFRCFDETGVTTDDHKVSLQTFSQRVHGSPEAFKEMQSGTALQVPIEIAPAKKQRSAVDGFKRWWFSLTAHLQKPTSSAEGAAYQEQVFGIKTSLVNGCPITPAVFNA